MLPSCLSSFTVSKLGSGFHLLCVRGFCFTGAHVMSLSFSQSGSRAAHDVVPPRHASTVHEVGQIGPRVDGVRRNRRRDVHGVRARRRDVVLRAQRGPFGNHEQVRRKAPRRRGLEHVILEHEVARVSPVVRDVAFRVVPHHVAAVRRTPGLSSSRATRRACVRSRPSCRSRCRRARRPKHAGRRD